MKNRNRRTNNKGFTMAELMLAVAIIAILGALAAVGVTRYLRGLRLLEMDNAAREIFYAAQNRITAELNSGTLGRLERTGESNEFSADAKAANDRGLKTAGDNPVDVKYAVVHSSSSATGYTNPASNLTLWDEMLPFGSIDDTLRSGGSYIITYSYDPDANMATVLDVWFASDEGSGFFRNWSGSEAALLEATYGELDAARKDKDKRRNFKGNSVIGYYGRETVTALSELYNFHDLTFHLVNDEVLYGEFSFQADQLQPSDSRQQNIQASTIIEKLAPRLTFKITGVDSGATKTVIYETSSAGNNRFIKLSKDTDNYITYRIILDDITSAGMRFRDLVENEENRDGKFILGEDISVNVEVSTNVKLANIDSATARDNSLFQYVRNTDEEYKINNTNVSVIEAGIGKIRHLQNLSKAVSGVELGIAKKLHISSAKQTANLNWKNFTSYQLIESDPTTKIGGNIVYDTDSTDNSFYPIDLKLANVNDDIPNNGCFLTYSAEYTVKEKTEEQEANTSNYKISNLVIGNDTYKPDHAGLFGTVDSSDSSGLTEGKHLLTVEHLTIEDAKIIGKETAGTVVANEKRAVILNDITISGTIPSAPEQPDKGVSVAATSGSAGGAVGKAINGLDLLSVRVSGKVTVTATDGNAGGLLGELDGSNVHMTINVDSKGIGCAVGDTNTSDVIITSTVTNTGIDTEKAAGGLVGMITKGLPTIKNSYSTAIVSGDIAGGLVGKVEDCSEDSTIVSCYVGGHVETDSNGMPVYSKDNFNVTGVTAAGGFIGYSDSANLSIDNCYTTASAQATGDNGVAGGFYGNGEEIKILGSYATGLVKAYTAGAFSGTNSVKLGNATTYTDADMNFYFELINEKMPGVVVPNKEPDQPDGIMSVETNTDSYNSFFKLRDPGTFFPYNDTLKQWFKSDVVENEEVRYRYFLPTAKDLDSSNTNAPTTHVGDWQPVDTLVFNSANP